MKQLSLIFACSLVLSLGACYEEPPSSDHSVHPRGLGFSVRPLECALENPLFPGLPGTCSYWEKFPPESHWSNNGNWNDVGNINNLNNINNGTNNINNQNNTNNTNNTTDPGRALEEADLIRVDGDLLYALSVHRGLLVFDLSDTSDLRILGSFPVNGTPFEMNVRDGVALVQFSQFWEYRYDENTCAGAFQLWSQLLALDVSDPTAIRQVGRFSVPGEISDSRLVGDILYLVSGQTGSCAGCLLGSGVSVLSVDVSDPSAPEAVARLDVAFPDATSLARRAVHFSAARIFVGGLPIDAARSRIQVIDISDPQGAMTLGDLVEVDGQINNRWQMDEADGVLRVVGQSTDWQFAPVVSTFEIRSSEDLRQLDVLALDMLQPEQLRTVRFDGPTAYLITLLPPRPEETEICDPLFIVDVSDPANLVQQGYYEMPGWVYFIEPRGDRLITLGFDNDLGGTLTVSQFDVSDPWNPQELVRVPFGGATVLSEDQSRIHKAMQVLDDRGLILVPYGARTSTVVQGVVQLFTFTHDTVTPVSELSLAGPARRAFFHDDDLIAFSSEQLAAWNLTDVASPQSLDRLDLVAPVYIIEAVGDDHVAVLTENAWTMKASLAIHDRDDRQFQTPVAVIDLEAAGVFVSAQEQYLWSLPSAGSYLFADDTTLHLLYRDLGYGGTMLASFDLTDPAAPSLIHIIPLPGIVRSRDARRPVQVSVEAGENAVFVNNFIVYRTEGNSNNNIIAVDVRDPAAPTHHLWIVPSNRYWMDNLGTLIVSGDRVY
ncbi:beta-propeller domain-containing protein, partial [Myxococcota bacterium]|nr:beta-propeller domain-containing protein [Myxococcota bacterium]